jgi:hypothetical protein
VLFREGTQPVRLKELERLPPQSFIAWARSEQRRNALARRCGLIALHVEPRTLEDEVWISHRAARS